MQILRETGDKAILPSTRKPREDVAVALRNPNLRETGFAAKADVSALNGVHALNIIVKQDGVMKLCPTLTQEFDPDTKLIGFDPAEPVGAEVVFEQAVSCDGYNDKIDFWLAPGSRGVQEKRPLVSAAGWAAVSTGTGEPADSVSLLVEDDSGTRFIVPSVPVYRPDLGKAFGHETLNNSGFSAKADLTGINGDIVVTLLVEKNGERKVCSAVSRRLEASG